MLEHVTAESTWNEIISRPEFAGFSPFLLSNCYVPDLNWNLKQMNEAFYDWGADSIAYGLNRIIDLIDAGERVAFDFYSADDREAFPDKQETKLFFMRGKPGKPFVMICPGGGYGAVCTLKEGFTTGARLNEYGYNAFILSYRLRARNAESTYSLMPKPIDDLAAAMRFIKNHEQEFGVTADRYGIAGFSSGGHLAGEWGTVNAGAVRYGLPRPDLGILIYPASDTTEFRTFNGRNILLEGMLGSAYTQDDVDFYNVNAHIDEEYPATYLMHCVDDPIVPFRTSEKMKEELEKNGRPYRLNAVQRGGHGFGLGEGSEAEGWLEDALKFWEEYR